MGAKSSTIATSFSVVADIRTTNRFATGHTNAADLPAETNMTQKAYERVFARIIESETDVERGVMMRDPALKSGGKVFTFYYSAKDAMCFRLGEDYDMSSAGISDFSYLSPFKNKPPMRGWYVVDSAQAESWDDLAKLALDMKRSGGA